MKEALYKIYDFTKLIKSNEITKEEYQVKYKDYLYCSHPGCNAKLVHVEIEKKNIAYFRTLKNNNHIDTCPNKFNRNGKRKKYSHTCSKEELNYSEAHIDKTLKDTFNKMDGKLKVATPQNTNSKNKSSPKTDKENVEKKIKYSYKAGGKVGKNTNKRETSIFKKNIKQFLKSKDGTYALYGYLCKMEFVEQQGCYLTLENEDEYVRLYVGSKFIKGNGGEFKKLFIIKNYIEKFNKKIKAVVICYKTKNGKEVIGEIIEHKAISLERMRLDKFIATFNLE